MSAYVYSYVHVRESLEKLDSMCQGCRLYANHYARQKLAYTCLDVDIHYGGLLCEHSRYEKLFEPAISHDSNSDNMLADPPKCLRHVRTHYVYTYTKWAICQVGKQCLTIHSRFLLYVSNFADLQSHMTVGVW